MIINLYLGWNKVKNRVIKSLLFSQRIFQMRPQNRYLYNLSLNSFFLIRQQPTSSKMSQSIFRNLFLTLLPSTGLADICICFSFNLPESVNRVTFLFVDALIFSDKDFWVLCLEVVGGHEKAICFCVLETDHVSSFKVLVTWELFIVV